MFKVHVLPAIEDLYPPYTVKPVLKGHCHERQPVLKDQIFLAEGPTFQCN